VLHRLADLHDEGKTPRDGDLRLIAVLGDGDPFDVLHREEWTSLLRDASIEHLGDVGMIHESQGLALELEAREDVPAVHSHLDEFDCHSPPNGLNLLSDPDCSHSAFADLFQQSVTARDDLACGSVGRWTNGRRPPFASKVESPNLG